MATAYTKDQQEFAQSLNDAFSYIAMNLRAKVITEEIHRIEYGTVMRVMLRYCMFLPEMLRPGFLIACGMPPGSIEELMKTIEMGEEIVQSLGHDATIMSMTTIKVKNP